MIFTAITRVLYILAGLVFLSSPVLVYAQYPIFGERIDLGLIENDQLDEISGIAASRVNENILYVHNDSGDINRFFALDTSGKQIGTYIVEGCKERDWEDIAVGPGPDPGISYIYLGNIGDNDAVYDLKYIYRFPEPEIEPGFIQFNDTIRTAEILTFQMPDGNRDTETVIVDPLTSDMYIVSKREVDVRVYRIPFPQSLQEIIIPERIASLRLTWIVGGDISTDGQEILIKNGDAVFYYKRKPGRTLAETFTEHQWTVSSYIPEPQGEAICWKPDGSGFYTVSEERNNIPARLYFYPKLKN